MPIGLILLWKQVLWFFTEGPHLLLCNSVTQLLGSQYFTQSNKYCVYVCVFGLFVDVTGKFMKYGLYIDTKAMFDVL